MENREVVCADHIYVFYSDYTYRCHDWPDDQENSLYRFIGDVLHVKHTRSNGEDSGWLNASMEPEFRTLVLKAIKEIDDIVYKALLEDNT